MQISKTASREQRATVLNILLAVTVKYEEERDTEHLDHLPMIHFRL